MAKPLPFIIGLCGPSRVGKSTTADALVNLLKARPNVAAWKESFATPLYAAVSQLTGESVEMIKQFKSIPYSGEDAPTSLFIGHDRRWALQVFGTEMIRHHWGPDFWVNHLQRRAKRRALSYKSKYPYVVIDDVRFKNEAMLCHVLIELSREGIDYGTAHESERRLPFDDINKPYHYLRLVGNLTDYAAADTWINNVMEAS